MSQSNQFSLFKKPRFGPFFTTQFLGAFNDNVYKNALIIMLAFTSHKGNWDTNTLINLSAGLFILPFFLFSATAGQLSDKYEKSRLIRYIKLLEIGIMVIAAVAFYRQDTVMLIGLLAMMGTQSALFGPIKYGILPQHLSSDELIGGNGLVEMGTFLAILLGTITGGLIIAIEDIGPMMISAVVIGIAVIGYVSSRHIPLAPAVDPTLKINWNPLTETWRTLQFAREDRTVFLSILGISWFWFYGATYLAQVPNYTRIILGGNEQVVTLLLAVFSIGIGLGSLLCERLSGRQVELGLVPFGSIGLTLFAVDLYFARHAPHVGELLNAVGFLSQAGSWRVLVDLLLIGVFGGFYIVPLYALVQQRSRPSHRSRIIAGNNILNAAMMVLSALLAIVLLKSGLSIPELLLITGLLNALVAIYIYTLVPEFLMRFLIWILTHTVYRVRKQGLENIPTEGPALLVCNHVSFVDALIIAGSCRRPVRFVMDHAIFRTPVLSFIFRTAKAIPIASARSNPEILDAAYDRIAEELKQGEVVCIFPEGKITDHAGMNPFKKGVEKIIARTPVCVIPMALHGLWGSFFSRKNGPAMSGMPRLGWSKIYLLIDTPTPSTAVTAEHLYDRVSALLKKNLPDLK